MRFRDRGSHPQYDGDDYGLYQIYGEHILAGADALVYVGKASRQTFSTRFKQHKWLQSDYGTECRAFLGRMQRIPRRHRWSHNHWKKWEEDVQLAEWLMIHKYSPNYNSASIARPPKQPMVLVHLGRRRRLERTDVAPDDL